MIFTVPIEKEVIRTNKNGEQITKNICYILQLLIMPDLCQAQYLVNNISEGIHRIKCNFGHNDKKNLKHGIKYKYRYCLKYKYRFVYY